MAAENRKLRKSEQMVKSYYWKKSHYTQVLKITGRRLNNNRKRVTYTK